MSDGNEQLLRENAKKLDKILIRIVGDEELKIKGLVHEQEEDNRFRKHVEQKLDDIHLEQKKQRELNQKVNDRLDGLEEYSKFFQALGTIKKRTWGLVAGVVLFFGTIAAWYDKFKAFLIRWQD